MTDEDTPECKRVHVGPILENVGWALAAGVFSIGAYRVIRWIADMLARIA